MVPLCWVRAIASSIPFLFVDHRHISWLFRLHLFLGWCHDAELSRVATSTFGNHSLISNIQTAQSAAGESRTVLFIFPSPHHQVCYSSHYWETRRCKVQCYLQVVFTSAFASELYLVVSMLRQSLTFRPQLHPTSSATVLKLLMRSSHAGYVILAFAHNFSTLTGGIIFYAV